MKAINKINAAQLEDLNKVLIKAVRYANDFHLCVTAGTWVQADYDAARQALVLRLQWIAAYLNAHKQDNLLLGTRATWQGATQDEQKVAQEYCRLSTDDLLAAFNLVNNAFQEAANNYGGLEEAVRAADDSANALTEQYKKMTRMLTAIYAGYNNKTEADWQENGGRAAGDAIIKEIEEQIVTLRRKEQEKRARLAAQQAEQARHNEELAVALGRDFVMNPALAFGLNDFPHYVWNLFEPVGEGFEDQAAEKKNQFIAHCNGVIAAAHPKEEGNEHNPVEIKSITRFEATIAAREGATAQAIRGLEITTKDGVTHQVYVNKDGIKAHGAANLVPAVFVVMALTAKTQFIELLTTASSDEERKRLCAKKIIAITQKGADVQHLIEASKALIDQDLIPHLPADLTPENRTAIVTALSTLTATQKRKLAEAYNSLPDNTKIRFADDTWMHQVASVASEVVPAVGMNLSEEDNDSDREEDNEKERKNEEKDESGEETGCSLLDESKDNQQKNNVLLTEYKRGQSQKADRMSSFSSNNGGGVFSFESKNNNSNRNNKNLKKTEKAPDDSNIFNFSEEGNNFNFNSQSSNLFGGSSVRFFNELPNNNSQDFNLFDSFNDENGMQNNNNNNGTDDYSSTNERGEGAAFLIR